LETPQPGSGSHGKRDGQKVSRLSIVVPLLNEDGNVPLLVGAVRDALPQDDSWELILVDDGSTDATPAEIRRAVEQDPRIRSVMLARNYGQSTAMQAGFDVAAGDIVVTMDGDMQNDPRDIPLLVATLEEGEYDLVAGYRMDRKDALLSRRAPSWVANRLIRLATGVPVRDNGCSLKAYRRDLLERVRLYSDMHRFIPALAAGTTSARITEIPVRHHPRRLGQSKYGITRVVKVLADLMTIKLLRSFRLRPMLALGGGALAALAIGACLAILAVVPMLTDPTYSPSVVFTGVALIWFALSVFLLMTGLIAEFVVQDYQTQVRGHTVLAREFIP